MDIDLKRAGWWYWPKSGDRIRPATPDEIRKRIELGAALSKTTESEAAKRMFEPEVLERIAEESNGSK